MADAIGCGTAYLSGHMGGLVVSPLEDTGEAEKLSFTAGHRKDNGSSVSLYVFYANQSSRMIRPKGHYPPWVASP